MAERLQPEQQTEIEQRVGVQIVQLYRAWSAFEQTLGEEKINEAIDFDLVSNKFAEIPPIASRQDAIERLEDLSERIDPTTTTLEFLKAKTVASATFLKAVEGEEFPFNEYCEKTVGIFPEIVSEEEIKERKEKADVALSKMGYNPDNQGYISFFSENLLKPEEIVADFNAARDKLTPIVVSSLGLEQLLPLEEKYDQEFAQENDYWICWIDGDHSKIRFRINLHPLNEIRWFKGSPELLAAHEMQGHLVQALNWSQNLRSGEINSGLGVTSIPGPEQWAGEGMAEALPALIPEVYENLSEHGQFAFEATALRGLVFNNVHILANEDATVEEIKDYVWQYLPHETDERIEKEFGNRTSSPFHKAYLMTYCDGSRFFNKAAEELGDKSLDLLQALYFKPMTPEQIKRLTQQLKSA